MKKHLIKDMIKLQRKQAPIKNNSPTQTLKIAILLKKQIKILFLIPMLLRLSRRITKENLN